MQPLPQSSLSAPSISMTTVRAGYEPSIAVNPTNPSNLIVSGGGVGSDSGDHWGVASVSSDGGRTWRFGNASLSYIRSIAGNSGWSFVDPVATFDASGNAYVGTIYGTMDWLFKSTDGGNSFLLTSPFLKMNDDLLDYQTGAIVHPCASGPDAAQDYPGVIADSYPTSPYRDNVYVLVRVGADFGPAGCAYGLAFERSVDGGLTWGSGMWLGPCYPNIPGCGSVCFGCDFGSTFDLSDNRGMAIAPDGTLFLAGLVFGGAKVLKSTDGGISFQELSINAPRQIPFYQIEVAAASATTIYAVVSALNATGGVFGTLHLYSLVSHDGGRSWSALARVDDVTYPDGTHLVAGPNEMWDFSLSPQTGRLDLAWLDSRNNPPAIPGNWTLADIYYSYSYDGLSWAANIRATQGPYYFCTTGSPTNCIGTGNDFMWVASSFTPGNDKAYIVASLGKADCGPLCSALLTRFVTVTFPSPLLSVSTFFTDPGLNPLSLDSNGNPAVSVSLARGVVVSTSPRLVLAWVNVTNTGSVPLDSLVLNQTLPVDWTTSPRILSRAAVHVSYANSTSLNTNPEITRSSMITVSTGDPETVTVTILNLTATAIGHPLMPGQGILVSVTLSYGLMRTSQSSLSYPRNHADTASAVAWTQPYYTGAAGSASGSSFLIAYARTLGDQGRTDNARILEAHMYTIL